MELFRDILYYGLPGRCCRYLSAECLYVGHHRLYGHYGVRGGENYGKTA